MILNDKEREVLHTSPCKYMVPLEHGPAEFSRIPDLETFLSLSYHKRQISKPPIPLPQCLKPPNFKSANATTSLTFDFGGYDYWRL